MDEKTEGTKGGKGGEKPKSEGKLGMIEDQLEDIVTDVKSNLNALFTRGEQFDELQSKSENLKEHSSVMRRRAKQIRIQNEKGNSYLAIALFACMLILFLVLSAAM